jgi:phosphate transport system substrate-binding protein
MSMKTVRPLHLLITFALVAPVLSCGGGTTSNQRPGSRPGAVHLRGAGATFPAALYKRWFAAYEKEHPDVAVAYDVVGSGEGVRRFIGKGVKDEEKVDFGASDAAMTDEQLATIGGDALMLPAAAGAVVLVYNIPDFVGELRLSRKAYEGIFLGQITKWNDPSIATANPGTTLPDLGIAVVVRQDGSGTTYAFTNHLDAISTTWHSRRHGVSTRVSWPVNAMSAAGNEGVAGRIKLAIGAIGYVNYESARQAGLPMAVLENKSGAFVKPTTQSGTAALASAQLPENLRAFVPDPDGPDAYPIVTFTWILLRRAAVDPEKAAALATLFHWCLSDGQKSGPELGYVELPPTVAEKALSAIDSWRRTAGSGSPDRR